MIRLFFRLVARECWLALRHKTNIVAALSFFALVGLLFPLALGPEPALLARLAPGIVWIAALLAALLPLDRLFGADQEDGSLEQWLISGLPPALLALGKALGHWLTTGVPLLLATPVLGFSLHIGVRVLPVLLLTMLLGTGSLSLLGTLVAALLLNARRGSVLLALLVVPLVLPALVLATAAADAARLGLIVWPHCALLAAFFLLSLCFFPIASSAALKLSVE
jgi:heme exporter protein B